MLVSTCVPDLGLLVYLLRNVYRPGDAALGLDYQRRVAVHRIVDLVIDQFGLDDEEAFEVAVRLVSVGVAEA